MDTKDPKTASRVWRWNLNGLGYSKTGYDGPYALAMTMDGQINADFITVGTLSANLIKGGILMSKNGASWINMDNGTFCFQAVKEAWMDTDTGEMSYEYEKVLELVDKVLKIYGRLGNLQYPNFYVQIGPNKEKSNGALTCFQDGTAFFRVSKNGMGASNIQSALIGDSVFLRFRLCPGRFRCFGRRRIFFLLLLSRFGC